MRTPLHRFNNDMVFVDGRMLQSAGWEGEVDEDSYYIDYDKGQVYIGVDPAGRVVEITAFDSALVRTSQAVHGKTSDRKGPTIRGHHLHAVRLPRARGRRQEAVHGRRRADRRAGRPADPSTFGKEVVGTVLENVTITYCSRVAGYFRGDGLVIRNSLVSDTSTEGIYVIGSSDVLLERNIIRRNNVEQLTGYYPAAVKIFNQTRRVTCRDNLVIDNPNSNGIWYDVGNRDAVFVNNRIENAQDGFFFEISRGAIVAGNVFVRCNKGIRVLNSADVRRLQQHVRRHAGLLRAQRAQRDRRPLRLASVHGPRRGRARGARLRRTTCSSPATATRSRCSGSSSPRRSARSCRALRRRKWMGTCTCVRPGWLKVAPASAPPLAVWSPAASDTCMTTAASLEEFRTLAPAFEAHGQSLDLAPQSVFKSPELGRYELFRALPEPDARRRCRRPSSRSSAGASRTPGRPARIPSVRRVGRADIHARAASRHHRLGRDRRCSRARWSGPSAAGGKPGTARCTGRRGCRRLWPRQP